MAIELADMVTVAEAAKKMAVTRQMVDYWIANGELSITRTPWGARLIERAALETFASTRALAPKNIAGRVNGALYRKGSQAKATVW